MSTSVSTPVTIVTGAGSGIGRAVCELLASADHRLALLGRTNTALDETMEAIAARSMAPPDMLLIPCDVSNREQAVAAVDMTIERWGRVDALVNNAGAAPCCAIDEIDEDVLFSTFAVNTFGPAYLIGRLWPIFRKQRSGTIVNVSSLAAHDPFPGFLAYAASKAALESFTRSAQLEGAEHGIQAYSVAPGAVETQMLRGLFSKEVVPATATLDPLDVARVVCDCVLGIREDEAGTVITVSK